MASEKQVQANRQNALRSTGPASPDGKARAARNSVKHGLLSRDLLIIGENPKELKAFREAMMAQLAPQGELEEFLADRVVASGWRLRRLERMEREIIRGKLLAQFRSRSRSPSFYVGEPAPSADSVAAHAMCHEHTYDRLGRYEAHIERALYRALHELQRLQAVRKGEQVPLPLVVDVDVAGLPSEEVSVPEHDSLQSEAAVPEATEAMAPVGGGSPEAGGDGSI